MNDFYYEKLRRYKRVAVDFRTGVSYRNQMTYCQTVSISEGGMMIAWTTVPPIGELVEVRLAIGADIISAKAKVIYVLPNRPDSSEQLIGLRFNYIDSRDLRLIREHVKNSVSAVPSTGAAGIKIQG